MIQVELWAFEKSIYTSGSGEVMASYNKMNLQVMGGIAMSMVSAKDVSALAKQPIPLLSNRVWRTYTGGKLIETWQGKHEPMDSSFPEEWIASLVRASNVGHDGAGDEGLSKVAIDDSSQMTLQEIIESAPNAFLGPQHATRYGATSAVLVKVLDAGERLTIQVHPDRQTAREKFNSEFGKTEAWYVIGGRVIDGEVPYVLLGFKPGMTRDKWRSLFDSQDIAGMIDALHRIPIQEGEVYLIEGGMPHAIGEGCLLVEIQEPTDYTLRTERVTPKGRAISDVACHQGLGFDAMFDCFHYDCYTIEELKRKFVLKPNVLEEIDDAKITSLISSKDTDRFRMNQWVVESAYDHQASGEFSIVIVVEGAGTLEWDGGLFEVNQGSTFFLPASLAGTRWTCTGGKSLRIVQCYPPEA